MLCDARTVRAKRATLRIAAGVAHLCDLGDTVAKLGAKGAIARIATGVAHLSDLVNTEAKLGAERATAGVAAGVAHLSDSLLARVNMTNSACVRALVADFFGDEPWSFRD